MTLRHGFASQGSAYTQTFDAENRLISVAVSGQTTTFVYDGDGNLVKKIKPDGSKTIYVGGIYEVDKTSGGTVTRTVTYYPAGGAMRINSTLYYILKDHLGSASVVTDASGNILGEQRYYPFGETRLTTGTIYTDRLFTGQREMTGLAIYHFNARFYSPKLGRFLSPDSIVPSYANPQSLNRFSYVLNSPLNYTDPSGHKICDEVDSAGNCYSYDDVDIPDPNPPGNNNNNNNNDIRDVRCHNDPDCVLGDGEGGIDDSGTGGLRWPDYWTGQFGFSLPGISTATLGIVSGAVTLTCSNGHCYVAGGANGGKTFVDILLFKVPASGNISGGWLFQSEKASPDQMHSFLTGLAINISLGAVVGGGVTWGNVGKFSKNDFAGEGGLYSPQVGVTATYTILDVDLNSQNWTWTWLP